MTRAAMNYLCGMLNFDIPQLKYSQEPGRFFMLAGPCAIESRDMAMSIAEKLTSLSEKYKIPLVFKGSYRKANRTSLTSFTGIGNEKALQIIKEVGTQFGIPTVTDIHETHEAQMAAEYVDVLQIPAFLFRQTNLLVAAANTGKVVNIKKGQFAAANAMQHAMQKCIDSGNSKILLTERGNSFGYSDLVVDMCNIPQMQSYGAPVVMDITHSLQQPNQSSGVTGGKPQLIETIAKSAIAAGADGIFIETHPKPSEAKSDGANMLALDKLEDLLIKLVRIKEVL
jgi:2-dehydro-3-deoxyphosphooctonate aldolase (KDO 8-P synthase)